MPAPIIPANPIEVTSPPSAHGWPVLRLGFRPFYLGAAAFASVAIPMWVGLFLGRVTLALAIPSLLWHAHEMLFGFAVAIIIGFLLTAGKAWTGLTTPRGAFLGALVTLWFTARILAIVGPYSVYAVLDLVLLPLVAAILADVLIRAGNRRNLPLILLLLLLSLANLAFHLAVIGAVDLAPIATLYAGLALIVMIECVIAGRVIPAFTSSAIPGLKIKPAPKLEWATLGTTLSALALWVFAPPGPTNLAVFTAAALLHTVRQWRWHPWATRERPILWILHAAYAWIPIGLGLLGLAQIGWVSVSAGVHALAVGATGGLIMGMITRTARGHTGRPLKASKPEVLVYVLVMTAAVLRVLGPLAMPQWLPHLLISAALAWCIAFFVYLVVYGPWLMTTRLDGKDG